MIGPLATRRQVMTVGGFVLTGGVLPDPCAGEGDDAAEADTTVVLLGRHQALPGDVLQRFAANGSRVLQLEEDPVRQWRGARAGLLAARDTRLLGLTSWPQFLLVRGLAEESGRRVRYQRLDVANGTITWLIA